MSRGWAPPPFSPSVLYGNQKLAPSLASPSTWRSPARRLRPCLWAEGWPAPCPRSRSRWSRTTTRTWTPTGLGTWAVRPRYEADARCLVDRITLTARCGPNRSTQPVLTHGQFRVVQLWTNGHWQTGWNWTDPTDGDVYVFRGICFKKIGAFLTETARTIYEIPNLFIYLYDVNSHNKRGTIYLYVLYRKYYIWCENIYLNTY